MRQLSFLLLCAFPILYLELVGSVEYIHDGKTVYCWQTNEVVYAKLIKTSNITKKGMGRPMCPVALKIELKEKTVQVNERLNISWSATYIPNNEPLFSPVAVNLSELANDSSGKKYQVIHSNIHGCEYGSSCDPTNPGKNAIDPSVNQMGNFTKNYISFKSSELSFSHPGEYTILAHIVLPAVSPGPHAIRLDFAVYTKILVKATTSSKGNLETSGDNDDGNGSITLLVIMCAILGVVVILIVIVLIKVRTSKNQQSEALISHNYIEDSAQTPNLNS